MSELRQRMMKVALALRGATDVEWGIVIVRFVNNAYGV